MKPNSIQPTGASRFGQCQLMHQWRLAPAADADRWARTPRTLRVFSVLLALVVLYGCGRPTRFERTVSQLKPGMNRDQVKALFADDLSKFETNEVTEVRWATFHSTNKESASRVAYEPSYWLIPSGDICWVFFDTNGVIIAHHLILTD